MDTVILITILIVIVGLAFDFINGFHDIANAVATCISTRALKPRVAISMAAVMNFLGAISFTGVAESLTKSIVDPFSLNNGEFVVLCGLVAAVIWNLLTWLIGMPSSSSHALIGAIAGAAIASAGFSVINFSGFTTIIIALIISPIIGFSVGYLIYSGFKWIFRNRKRAKTNRHFRVAQIFTAAIQAYAHGTNDAQKTMGVITLALITSGLLKETAGVPFWVQLSCALAMAIGSSVGGFRIIKTVGTKIMRIEPVTGVAADISSLSVIMSATLTHLPVSTTQVIDSSIMGVGTANHKKEVNWRTGKNMLVTWVITLPIAATLAALVYWIAAFLFL
ncbi:inorganic phosphate transporter [Listeria fleischmannii]|jgi:PiT family inorganic phosphate transporter|uniref:Phosphate transporter family protein n=2 Tax=Listeria fleischmannii TaxID=1069827 RepID=W7DE24_9LIST|nr:inorganic phosphate transporter [Listeria fleischmannii]EIA20051.1 phosphate transporter family protein [Listeria fleischmannii subsp. coloradonensis]EUJ53490.1 phosphate transporter family protein [Listeria fleischmannii FSL S10-1203]MBC1398637.1 inorganic phosphate transporter [Listeria fleischmannii]MBC1427019.1 inorganic phosphate transporter [Listeria fleischmannii]STY36021.1 Low-affinity inorganic phosphate transporter 1 [Listeria fleischmannii subsp. coloradonensis]